MIKARALIPVMETGADRPGANGSAGALKPGQAGIVSGGTALSASQKILEKLLWNPRSMVIQAPEKAQPVPESVLRLADEMLENRELIETVIESLRKSIPAKKYSFSLNVDAYSKAEQKKLLSILYDMAGVMANVHLSGTKPSVLSGRLIASSRAQSFITGRYVEYALYFKARELVRKVADQLNTTWQVFHNVIITNPDHVILNEFDLVIEFGGQLYVVEIKSGRNFSDFDKYMQIVSNYQLDGRFMLVTSSLSDEIAERIEYFCGYCACGLESGEFETRLKDLLMEGWRQSQKKAATRTAPVLAPSPEGYTSTQPAASTGSLPVRQILYGSPMAVVRAAQEEGGVVQIDEQAGQAVLSSQLVQAVDDALALHGEPDSSVKPDSVQTGGLEEGEGAAGHKNTAFKPVGMETVSVGNTAQEMALHTLNASVMSADAAGLAARLRLVEDALYRDPFDSMSWDEYEDDEDDEEEDNLQQQAESGSQEAQEASDMQDAKEAAGFDCAACNPEDGSLCMPEEKRTDCDRDPESVHRSDLQAFFEEEDSLSAESEQEETGQSEPAEKEGVPA